MDVAATTSATAAEQQALPAVKLRRFKSTSSSSPVNSSSHSRRTSEAGHLSPPVTHHSKTTHPQFKRKQTAIILEAGRNYFSMAAKFLHKQSYLLSLLSLMVSKFSLFFKVFVMLIPLN